jgi:outer membrane lipoprotein LolB
VSLCRVAAAALVLLLAACSGVPRREAPDAGQLAAQAAREAQLAAQPQWTLQGKVAVRSGKDGGSGQLRWQEASAVSVLELRAPISGQGWRLQVDAAGALLEGLDGGPRRDRDARRLLREALGWELPVAALRQWVRGARADRRARIHFAADGLPASLSEAGWTVDYLDWDRGQQPPLPRRLLASRGEHRVRLVVGQWSTP